MMLPCCVISLILLIVWQCFFSSSVNYYLISLCVLILSMLPFFLNFEIKSISADEITLVATFIALAIVSRVAFYLLPQVKPIGAVVIVSAVCLGGERGYIVGALSAFVSNFIFGQGYWTAYQMVALGLVGLLAGMIFNKIKAKKINLAIYGFFSIVVVYGLIVDLSTIFIMYGDNLNISSVMSVYLAGLPFNVIFGLTTALFLFLFGESFIKKVNRVITKYGIIKTVDE